MEVGSLSSAMVALDKMMVRCAMEAVVVETLVAAGRSLASILMMGPRLFQSGLLLNVVNASPEIIGVDERFPFDELHRRKRPDTGNTDGSETEDDDEEDDDNEVEDADEDDEGDEDFSGEEGEDDEGDPEDDPAANGDGGSDDDDDDDDGDDDDEDGNEEEGEEDEEDEDEEIPQPPAKKRK